jgi:hypothetical protein
MPTITLKRALSKVPSMLFWSILLFLSLLLTHNAVLYFTHGGEYGILPEKVEARKILLWNLCFYTHLPCGIICLMTPFISFARNVIPVTRKWHHAVGKLYVWITIVIVCPTGMYLALYAKGGLITTIGFLLQGILLAYYTWHGYIAMQRGDKAAHIQNMIRSYATATVVLTFRVLHILFFFLYVPYSQNYAISQWLGMTSNLLLAELIILALTRKYSSLKTQQYETV